ncbi:PilZ domain-containing protein [Geobacter pelophilus]|uniref:PilZ domain-containing protein n=1 Tax=Geoanaerobacter pelophilus TaxID=60036 RepID=A0AAW4L6M9_9BACT|nr:PilZ domain-containing protein [Geoanaerobacter pelophilus]MBT0663891.1 PilZ domain-containing protein [Geoanaerobacter pelophilus]
MEKRKYSRVPFHAPVFVSSRGRTYAGEVENVCHGGMFIKTYGDFSAGEQVLVSVSFIEGSSNLSVTMPGRVARQTSDGVALHSPHIDTHSLIHLEYLMASNNDKRDQLMTDFVDYVTSQQDRRLL